MTIGNWAGPHFYPDLSALDLVLFRSPGPGLGNLLFPACRALVLAESWNGVFIHPTWRQIKFGPLLRGERDLRTYGRIFRHRSPSELYAGCIARLRLPQIDEIEFQESIAAGKRRTVATAKQERLLVRVAGVRSAFGPLIGHRELVRSYIKRICRQPARANHQVPRNAIGVHIRMGDFSPASSAAGPVNRRIPLDWYIAAVRHLRSLHGQSAPILLFSDGSDAELAPLLDGGAAKRYFAGNAILDMLALSNCSAIVCSSSTFSLWAVFLSKDSKALIHPQFDPVTDLTVAGPMLEQCSVFEA